MRFIVFLIICLTLPSFGICQEAILSGAIGNRTLNAMKGGVITVDCYFPYFGTVHNAEIATKIEVDSLTGTFSCSIPLKEPAFTTIEFMGQKLYVYLETGWHTNVTLETNRYGRPVANFQGDGKTENEALLKEISKQHFRLIDRYFDDNLDKLPLRQLTSGYQRLLVQDTTALDTLFHNNLVSKQFHELGKKYLQVTNIFLGTSRLISLYYLTEDTVRRERIKAIMHEAADWIDVTDSNWFKVPSWPIVLTAYSLMKDFTEDGTDVKQPYAVWNIHDRLAFLPEPAREAGLFALLAKEIQRKYGEFQFKDAYSFFQEHYPESRYSPFLQGLVKQEEEEKQLTILYEGEEKPSDDKWLSFMMDYQYAADTLEVNEFMPKNFKQLLDAIQHGEPIYIDFWATWCIPCRQEFPYSVARGEDFKKAGVMPVYVSIDAPAIYGTWSSSITEYKLEGRHVLISKELHKKLTEEIGLHTIPRYMLIDDKGNIVDSDASRPSDTQGIRDALKKIAMNAR